MITLANLKQKHCIGNKSVHKDLRSERILKKIDKVFLFFEKVFLYNF